MEIKKKAAVTASLFIFIFGFFILAGWLLDIGLIKGALSEVISIKVNTAIAFILTGFSLLLQLLFKESNSIRRISNVIAWIITAIGVFTLAEYIFNTDLGIDQLVINEKLKSSLNPIPGRMSSNTAIAFIFSGLALIINSIRKPWAFKFLILEILAFIVIGFGLTTLMSYFSGIITLAESFHVPLMAVPTAILFIIIGAVLIYIALTESTWKISLDRNILYWFGGSLAAIIVISLLSYRNTLMMLDDESKVNDSNIVLQSIDEVVSNLKDAETGQRGYILTGRTYYLSPYFKAIDKMSSNISTLKQLTSNNASQQKRVNIIESLSGEKIRELRHTIVLRDSTGFNTALKEIMTDKGKEIMDSIRIVSNELKTAESALLINRQQQSNSTAHLTLYFVPFGVFFSVGFLFAAIYIVDSENKKRKSAESELQKLNEELEERVQMRTAELARSNAELEQFAYVASHDLQEPLRMVASYTVLLGRRYKGKLDKDADEFIGFAVDGANRIQRLITDLLSFSRVTIKGRPFERVSFSDIMSEALINLKVLIEETNAKVNCQNDLPVIYADRTQIVRLLRNLIDNAIKYRKEGIVPEILISSRTKETEWEFSVKDNGLGISPEYFERIFQIFQRLHTKEEYPGTGIGLAVCKRIAERHGGRIWVDSQEGEGTTFYFTIKKESQRSNKKKDIIS